MRIRVSSHPTSSGLANDASPGCPVPRILRPRWRRISGLPRIFGPFSCAGTDLRVASNLAPFSGTVDETPGCPDSSLCGIAYDESPGCPESCIFRLCRRWIFELPRISHPLALPVVKSRVAPFFRSSGIASDEVASCPASCISGTGWCSPELPRIWHLPVVPVVNLRVAPNLRSSGPPTDRISKLPRIFDPSAVPTFKFPGCPESLTFRRRRLCFLGLPRLRIYGWIDDESPSVLELCILWQAS